MASENIVHPKKKRVLRSTLIDHTYHDYAIAPIQNVWVTDGTSSTGRSPNFPAKLHQIVSTPGYQHIIAWLPHGRSWAIRNKELLVSAVLNEHFSHGNFESFNRQVNIWGFKVREYCASYSWRRWFQSRCRCRSEPFTFSIAIIEAFVQRRPWLQIIVSH